MPGQRWMILAVLFAARAATGFQFQSVGSTAPMLMQDLAIDYSEIGMLLGAYLLPGVIVAFPTGVLGQRFRDKTLGLVGLLLMAASAAVLGAAEGFAIALVARIIGGVGATIVALVATKMKDASHRVSRLAGSATVEAHAERFQPVDGLRAG